MHRGRSASIYHYHLINSFLGSEFIEKQYVKTHFVRTQPRPQKERELFNIAFTFQLDPGRCLGMLLRRKLSFAKRDKGDKLLIECNTMVK